MPSVAAAKAHFDEVNAKHGLHGCQTTDLAEDRGCQVPKAELSFDNVKVPKANLPGGRRGGFKTMMMNLAKERLFGACGFAARAEQAFNLTMEYITEQRAFGRPIGTFQNARFKMASMRIEIDAAWALTDHCTRIWWARSAPRWPPR